MKEGGRPPLRAESWALSHGVFFLRRRKGEGGADAPVFPARLCVSPQLLLRGVEREPRGLIRFSSRDQTRRFAVVAPRLGARVARAVDPSLWRASHLLTAARALWWWRMGVRRRAPIEGRKKED